MKWRFSKVEIRYAYIVYAAECLMMKLTANATLSPSMWLSIGEPKQEAKAICVFPDLATTLSATQSAIQLPRANTVIPRIAAIYRERTGG